MKDSLDSERGRDLERMLRDEAAAGRRAPRRSVAEQVIDALPDRGATLAPTAGATSFARAVEPGPRTSPVALAGRFALAAAVAAGLYGLWTWDTVERAPGSPGTVAVATAPRVGLDRLRRLDGVDLSLPNPLLEEARRLGRDATSATGFLATRLPPEFRSALFSRL